MSGITMGFVLWKNHGNFVGNGAWEFEITEWQRMKDERHNIQILKLLQVKAIRDRTIIDRGFWSLKKFYILSLFMCVFSLVY